MVKTVRKLDADGKIGVVERFSTDDTRSVYLDTSQLVQWAIEVESKFGSGWTEVSVTPDMPIVAYEKTVEDHTHGIALAPGLYPEDYEELGE